LPKLSGRGGPPGWVSEGGIYIDMKKSHLKNNYEIS